MLINVINKCFYVQFKNPVEQRVKERNLSPIYIIYSEEK